MCGAFGTYWGKRNSCRIMVQKPKRKRPLGKTECRQEHLQWNLDPTFLKGWHRENDHAGDNCGKSIKCVWNMGEGEYILHFGYRNSQQKVMWIHISKATFPNKSVIGNCLVHRIMFQTKQHQFQVWNILFIMPDTTVCVCVHVFVHPCMWALKNDLAVLYAQATANLSHSRS